eukprot:TRINITY_DN3578_c0_g1_i3.p1 TRINITY_DN3578_c0_g1~~TRINITY_DN3578_c0_g1_i3.p1  ORF type:complete len:270 (-),score=92.88 TRINITY_DN3578_c0_g1_i3:425-1234(-)
MEKRISLESRGKDPAQVEELNLDNCRTVGEFEGLTSDFVNLNKLSVIKAGLTSFKGFPGKLSNLQKLDVSENRISNGLHHIQDCPSLTHLCLSGNKFKEVTVLEPLKNLDKLTHLELANTPISEGDDYRSQIFNLLPNLKSIDGQDRDGNEASSSDDENEGGEATEKGESTENGVNDKELEDEEEDLEDGEEEEESEEESEEEEDGPGLAALYSNANLEDSEGDEDFKEDGVEPEDDDDLDDSEDETSHNHEEENTRGKKRKHEDEETG